MDVSEAKHLRTLEDENAKLKKLLTVTIFDNVALKNLLARKCTVRPVHVRFAMR